MSEIWISMREKKLSDTLTLMTDTLTPSTQPTTSRSSHKIYFTKGLTNKGRVCYTEYIRYL